MSCTWASLSFLDLWTVSFHWNWNFSSSPFVQIFLCPLFLSSPLGTPVTHVFGHVKLSSSSLMCFSSSFKILASCRVSLWNTVHSLTFSSTVFNQPLIPSSLSHLRHYSFLISVSPFWVFFIPFKSLLTFWNIPNTGIITILNVFFNVLVCQS